MRRTAARADQRVGLDVGLPINGEPRYCEQKILHVQRSLAAQNTTLADCKRSWSHSDSMADLPLPRAVGDPLAVRPNTRLWSLASAQGRLMLEGEPDRGQPAFL